MQGHNVIPSSVAIVQKFETLKTFAGQLLANENLSFYPNDVKALSHIIKNNGTPVNPGEEEKTLLERSQATYNALCDALNHSIEHSSNQLNRNSAEKSQKKVVISSLKSRMDLALKDYTPADFLKFLEELETFAVDLQKDVSNPIKQISRVAKKYIASLPMGYADIYTEELDDLLATSKNLETDLNDLVQTLKKTVKDQDNIPDLSKNVLGLLYKKAKLTLEDAIRSGQLADPEKQKNWKLALKSLFLQTAELIKTEVLFRNFSNYPLVCSFIEEIQKIQPADVTLHLAEPKESKKTDSVVAASLVGAKNTLEELTSLAPQNHIDVAQYTQYLDLLRDTQQTEGALHDIGKFISTLNDGLNRLHNLCDSLYPHISDCFINFPKNDAYKFIKEFYFTWFNLSSLGFRGVIPQNTIDAVCKALRESSELQMRQKFAGCVQRATELLEEFKKAPWNMQPDVIKDTISDRTATLARLKQSFGNREALNDFIFQLQTEIAVCQTQNQNIAAEKTAKKAAEQLTINALRQDITASLGNFKALSPPNMTIAKYERALREANTSDALEKLKRELKTASESTLSMELPPVKTTSSTSSWAAWFTKKPATTPVATNQRSVNENQNPENTRQPAGSARLGLNSRSDIN